MFTCVFNEKGFVIDAGNRFSHCWEKTPEGWVKVGGGHMWQSGSPRVASTASGMPRLNLNTGEYKGTLIHVDNQLVGDALERMNAETDVITVTPGRSGFWLDVFWNVFQNAGR